MSKHPLEVIAEVFSGPTIPCARGWFKSNRRAVHYEGKPSVELVRFTSGAKAIAVVFQRDDDNQKFGIYLDSDKAFEVALDLFRASKNLLIQELATDD